MKDQVKRYLDNLPTEFKPVVEQATRYYSFDDKADIRKDGAIQIFNRTWVAPGNYGLLLFPPADNKLIAKFEKQNKLKTPKFYKSVLGHMNGCFIYDFALYGLPESMYSSGLLNRSSLYQFDLGTANQFWKYEYETDTDNLFHIGGRAYSFDENIGYFIDSDGNILSLRKNGKQLRAWTNFGDFMKDEIKEAEKMMTKEIPKKYQKK
jgi:hypothetical protein